MTTLNLASLSKEQRRELFTELRKEFKGRASTTAKASKDQMTRATVAVLNTLAGSDLPTQSWYSILEKAKRWLGKDSSRKK
jgi:uncharacterized protein (DUF927 family)